MISIRKSYIWNSEFPENKMEDIPALNLAKKITLGELVEQFGNLGSERVFSQDDYKIYLLNQYLEHYSS